MRNKIIEHIFSVAKDVSGFDRLEKFVNKFSKKDTVNNLVDCGVMPEIFDHDSSEEKMWAKYSDILLSHSFELLGLKSEVLGTRGDSADVLAKAKDYSIVADAKTFRLSRTAKNQKDFKVQALDNWRQNHHYSVLVSPLFQYPTRKSQIYSQAIKRNVTLLSYTHLKFILEKDSKIDLTPLWNIGNTLKKEVKEKNYTDSSLYWNKIDEIVCKITNSDLVELTKYKKDTINRTQRLGREGIDYWNKKIEEYKQLPKEKAIKLLIKAHKIDKKIIQIKKAISIKV